MKIAIRLFFLLIPFTSISQQDKSFSVYLIGDAGEDTVPGKALLMLKDELINHPNSAVVFLGDNVYPDGLKKNDRISSLHLESQLQILKEYKGQAYFIPGNHDWSAQGRKGLNILKNQQVYVDAYLKNNSTISNKNKAAFLPENGLPGPESIMLNDKVRLIIIDTQWFLHLHKKNKTGSKKHTKELFYSHLDSLLAYSQKDNEQVIVATHHPMYTNGQHSRSREPLRFLVNYTPFQIFGLLGLDRLFSQDIVQPRYKKMRKRLLGSFSQYNNIIYASGHDHNMQCFKEGANHYIVSGCGSKLSRLQKRKKFDAVFEDDTKTGFVKLEYSEDGKHATLLFRVDESSKLLEGF